MKGPWPGTYALASISLVIVALSPRPGVTWDEPGYLAQGIQHVDWLGRVFTASAGANDPLWGSVQPDHPPLGKLVYGLAARIRPADVSALAAARWAASLQFALLVALTAHAAFRLFGERAAWIAGIALMLTPQVLAHAQLAALDLPMTLAWMAAATASLVGPTRWPGAILIGLLWGVALLTKVNGIFLAGPLFVWGLLARRMRWREIPAAVAAAAAISWIGWPWLQHNTLAHVSAYLLDKQVRWIVPTFYMGQVYREAYPPWHYPLVMTVATLPLVVLVGAIVGLAALARSRTQAALWLAVHLLCTLGLACMPGVPRYNGTRLFLPAFPFLAIAAAHGLDRLLDVAASARALNLAARVIVVLAAGSAALGIHAAAPCLLSAYSPAVGGLAGAERLGFETTFWGDAVAPELLAAIPPGATVGAVPMGIEYVRALQQARLLPARASPAPEDRSDVLIVLGRKSMLSDELRKRFETSTPLAETRRGGVALAKLLPGNIDTAAPARP